MSVKQRIEKLEAKTKPTEREYPVHIYEVTDGQSEHTRENCPQCAAMTEEEYAGYERWLAHRSSDCIAFIEVRKSRTT